MFHNKVLCRALESLRHVRGFTLMNSPLRVLKYTECVSLIDQLSTKTSVLLLARTAQAHTATNSNSLSIFVLST